MMEDENYRAELRISSSVEEVDPEERLITSFKITLNRDTMDDEEIGYLYGHVLLGDLALAEDLSIWDACDAESTELEHLASTFYTKAGHLRTSIKGRRISNDMLFLETLKIEPKYRRMGLGLKLMEKAIYWMANSPTPPGWCGVVACKPYPLQYSGCFDDNPEAMPTAIEESREFFKGRTLTESTQALTNYYRKIGFKKGPESYLYKRL